MKVSELSFVFAIFYEQNKIELTPQIDVDAILVAMTEKYKNENISTVDGVKLTSQKTGFTLENQTQSQLFEFTRKQNRKKKLIN